MIIWYCILHSSESSDKAEVVEEQNELIQSYTNRLEIHM